MVKKEIPLLLKRKKAEWEKERSIKENKKKIFEENRKQRTKKHYQDISNKGREYEVYVAEHFEKLGYKVKNHGIIHGKKDKGIDVIVMKGKEITLIQCKNWKKDSKFKVNHEKIKAFIGDTTAFLDNNKDKADGYTIKRLYITSNDVLDSSAKHFIEENRVVEHMILPMAV